MSLFNRDNSDHEVMFQNAKAVQANATKHFDALDKLRDPLDFFWKKGSQHLRDNFQKTLDFRPQPEDNYQKDKYCD